MLQVLIFLIKKEESASLEIMTMTAISVIAELGLKQKENMLTATRVERRQCSGQIMETSTLNSWVISCCSDKKNEKRPEKTANVNNLIFIFL